MNPIDEKLKYIKLIAFDLDNTLYDENQYFEHAIKLIGLDLEKKLHIESGKTEKILWKILKKKGLHYHHLFDDFLAECGLESKKYLSHLIELFKKVNKKLELFPGVRDLLTELKNAYTLSMITNGMYEVQKNKIRLLDLESFFDPIIFSSQINGSKLAELSFKQLLEKTKTSPKEVVYIGDNPLTDFKGANSLGIITIRVENPAFSHINIDKEWDAILKVNSVVGIKGLFL